MSVFFSSRKTVLKSWLDTSSIASYLSSFLSFFLSQSRQHLDTWWIDQESFWPLDSFSTPGGSIEPHLLLLVFLFLDSFSTQDLSTLLSLTPSRQMSRHHLDTSSVEIYWGFYLSSSCNPPVISRYLSRLIFVFSPKHSLLSLKFVLQGFFKLHQAFLHLVSFYSLALHAFMFLKPRFWDFFKKKIGIFQIWWDIDDILG